MAETPVDERPAGRRRTGRRPRISRELILEAAKGVNADELTMPDLAASLGVTTSALYHYFPGKQALADALAGEMLSSVELPDPEDLGWREWLRALAYAFRKVCIEAWPVPPYTTAAMRAGGSRMFDATFHVLLREGFTAEETHTAYEAVVGCGFYWAGMAKAHPRGFGGSASEVRDRLLATTGPLSHTEEIVNSLVGYDPERRFALAVELVLDGIATRLDTSRVIPSAEGGTP